MISKAKIGKMGAAVIDTTAQSWARAPQDDPTSPLWVPKDNPAWRSGLKDRMRDEYGSGLECLHEEVQDEPLYED